MNVVSPEMVLGKDVVNDRGDLLGAVVDVGVHDLRRVKFLLVQARRMEGISTEPVHLTRLSVDEIDSVGTRRLVLKPHPA